MFKIRGYRHFLIPSSGATLKAVLAKPVTITWLDNNGVSVAGGKTSVIIVFRGIIGKLDIIFNCGLIFIFVAYGVYELISQTQSYTNAMIPSSGATLKAVLAKPVTITWLDNNGLISHGYSEAE